MPDRTAHRTRRLPAWGLVGIGGLVLAGAVVWLVLPAILERVLVDRLVEMGVPSPRLSIVRLGLERSVVRGIRAGQDGEFTADEIVVDYHLPEILEGTLRQVVVRGARLSASLGPDGLSLGSLDPLLAGGGGGELPALPPIRLDAARLDLATDYGIAQIIGDGTLSGASGRISASLDLSAGLPQGEASGKLDLDMGDGEIAARLAIADGRIDLPDLLDASGRGEMVLRLANGEISTLTADLTLAAVNIADDRAAGLGPLSGRLVMTRQDGPWEAAATLEAPEGGLEARLRASTPELDLTQPAVIALDLRGTGGSALWSLLALPLAERGGASLSLVAEVAPSALQKAVEDAELPVLTGSVALNLRGLAVAGLVRDASIAGGFDVASDAGTIRLEASAPILAELSLDPVLLPDSGLPPTTVERALRPLTVTVEVPAPLQIRTDTEAIVVAGSPRLAIDLAEGHPLLRASGDVRITSRPTTPLAVELSSLEIKAAIPEGTELPAGSIALTGSAAAGGGNVTAHLTLAAAAAAIQTDGLSATDVALNLPLTVYYGGDRLTASLSGAGSLSARRVGGLAPLRLSGPVQLPFIPGDVPLLAMDLTDLLAPRAAIDLTAGPLRLSGTADAEHGPMELRLSLPRLALHADFAEAEWRGKITSRGGRLDIPTYQIEATDLDLAAELPMTGQPRIAVSAGLAHRAERPVVVPLSARLEARREKAGWSFTGRAADAFDQLSIDIAGSHDLARGRGKASLKVGPIDFAPGLRQPADLAPFVSGVAEDVTGTVALAGSLSWDAERIASDLELLLRDLSAVTDAATITRLNGVIAVDGLSPFTTPPGQQVAVAAIDAGLPFTDGLLTFRIAPGPTLEIAGGELHLAGGTVELEPLVIDPARDGVEAALMVTGVQLGQLLALAGIDGLSGDGRLSGRIPVTFRDRDVIITQGELAAEAPGWLSYAPLQPPAALQGQGETVSLALSALTNFHYQELRLTVDRQAGGEMVVAMHVRGNNPDFYDGYPVEFNLNVSGALDRVLRQSLAGYRIPEAIEEQFERFAQ